jgi:hypothetical protein
MARKVVAAPKKPAVEKAPECTNKLIDAIVAVRHLQDFIKENGGLEKAVGVVARVEELVKLTGSFEQLKEALAIVGKEEAAPAPQA